MSTPKGDNDGLLSRMARFVRNPTAGWSETEVADDGPESGYNRQLLKEMIERKRRNDFVRKREFDMLRKLRRAGIVGGHDPTARPSFFQSSMPSRPDDRASTLKKIDEIEAQMSQQWWKTNSGVTSTRGAGIDTGAHVPARALLPELDLPTQPPEQAAADAVPDVGALRAMVRTTIPATLPAPLPPSGHRPVSRAAQGPSSFLPSSGFALSKAHALEVAELAHDPELEEAAIRYANGDIAGAELALRALLAPGSTRAGHQDTWLALFDLYRATGQSGRYDEYALAFANRFRRSAPQWRPLGPPGAPAFAPEVFAGGGARFLWVSPPVLEAEGVAELRAAVARSQPEGPWRMDWAPLARIQPDAVTPLLQLFAQWCTQPVHVHFHEAAVLQHVLADSVASGDRKVDPAWWKLRLQALRLMHRPDEFELAALDYCVTYEVSPPTWESPRSHYRAIQADAQDGRSTLMSGLPRSRWSESQAPSTVPPSTQPGPSEPPPELAGTVLGDASSQLERIDHQLAGMDLMVVSCARLVRMDFAAAGTLLNWATAHSAEGRLIHLVDVNRMVAEFFHVIGISTQARITVRRD